MVQFETVLLFFGVFNCCGHFLPFKMVGFGLGVVGYAIYSGEFVLVKCAVSGQIWQLYEVRRIWRQVSQDLKRIFLWCVQKISSDVGANVFGCLFH